MELIYYRRCNGVIPTPLKRTKIAFYELTVVIKGQMDYVINGKKVELHSGDALFLTPKTLRTRLPSTTKTTYVSFNFTDLDDYDYSFPIKTANALNNECFMLLTCANEIYSKYYTGVFNQIQPILLCFLANMKAIAEQTAEPPLIVKIKNYINTNYFFNITLKDVASAVFFSPSYCENAFKKATGTSIIQYLISQRIEKAKNIIMQQGLTLYDVAISVGFSDVNYFIRTFKKVTGMTPLQYKKSISFQ